MRKGKCRHFSSKFDNRCSAKVKYPKRGDKWPCFKTTVSGVPRAGVPPCDKYEEPTPEELAEQKAKIKEVFDKLHKVGPILKKIKDEHVGEDWRGTVQCPVCDKLVWIEHAAYNGHVWWKCETPGCVAGME